MANGAFISLSDAQDLVDRFKTNTTTIVNTPHGFWYDSDMINTLLTSHENAAGVRVYVGLTEENAVTTVLVAVDSSGNNLVSGENPCLDTGTPCPPDCGNNAL